MKIFFLVLFLIIKGTQGIVQDVRKNFGNKRFLSIPTSEITEEVSGILESFRADRLRAFNSDTHLVVSPEVIDTLVQHGVSFVDDTERFLLTVEANVEDEDFVCLEEPTICAEASFEDFHSIYQKFDSIHARFDNIASDNPSITQLEEFGDSFENRTAKILWIGNNLDSEEQPIIFYFCAIHAREWITPMFCTYMAEMLVNQADPVSEELITNFTFAIVPVSNPDGYVYSFEVDNAWRKTRKPNPTNLECPGTDANRNYAIGFGGEGASSDECDNTYFGSEPFDQPCVANIKAFVDEYQDRIVHINDIHSYGEFFLSPYASSVELPSDSPKHEQCSEAVFKAIQEESGASFKTGSFADALYVASGVSNDYFYSLGITHSYTYEARGGGESGLGGFQPPVTNIMPSSTELYAGMIALVRCVHAQEVLGLPVPGLTDSDDSTNAGLIVGLIMVGIGVLVVIAIVPKVMKKDNNNSNNENKTAESMKVSTKNPMTQLAD